jgi:glycerol-3-phosphate acyltransferase PlsY
MIAAMGTLFLAFLIGAIPFSFLLARLLGGVDIRRVGSGNIGATNLARTMGPWAGGAGLLLDVIKGVAAVLLARVAKDADPGGNLEVLAGGAAIVGHIYSPFLAFRGGKGVATGAGVFGLLAPWATLAALGVFIVATLLSRMVSLGSMLAAAALPIAAYLLGYSGAISGLAALVALLVVARHRSNLARILRGEERRWGATASRPGAER